MAETTEIKMELLTRESFEPFGWILGGTPTHMDHEYLFKGTGATAWHEHLFSAGQEGQTELLWIQYKVRPFELLSIESHRLTEQVFVPIMGNPLILVVAPPPGDPLGKDIFPDLGRLKAFLLDGSKGVCLKQGTWHTQFALTDPATYFMITRRSTTVNIFRNKHDATALTETVVRELSSLTKTVFTLVL